MRKELYTEVMSNMIQKYWAISKNEMKWVDKKRLAEFEFLLDDFIRLGKFDPIDLAVMQRISYDIADTLRCDQIIFYYSSFHYFYNAVYHRDDMDEIGKIIFQINIQISIMRIQIQHGYISGCSEDDYYFKGRGTELIDAIAIILNRGEREYIVPVFLYLLLNYLQSLLEYLQSDNDRYRDVVVKNATKCMELVKGYCAVEVIKEYIKKNAKIKSFIYKVAYMYNVLFDKTVDGIMEKVCAFEKSDVFSNDIWALNSIYYINKEKFNSVSNELLSDESEYEKIYEDAKLIYLKNNMYLLYESGDNSFDVIKLPDIKRDEDNTWFKMEYYFKGYEESFDIEITDEDINTLNGYNDEKLRSKIAKIIVNIDHHIVERESKKPHGALEISDMELPIRPQGKFTTYYLCIPVKSGVEIRNKVDESICYQIIRPFTNFANRAVVVFVSAKEASEAFYNYVKRAKANLNFDIYILEGKSLAKVLKYNNLLD